MQKTKQTDNELVWQEVAKHSHELYEQFLQTSNLLSPVSPVPPVDEIDDSERDWNVPMTIEFYS